MNLMHASFVHKDPRTYIELQRNDETTIVAKEDPPWWIADEMTHQKNSRFGLRKHHFEAAPIMSLPIQQMLQHLQVYGSPTYPSTKSHKSTFSVSLDSAIHNTTDIALTEDTRSTSKVKLKPILRTPRRWLASGSSTSQLPELAFNYCLDPELRELNDKVECDEDAHRNHGSAHEDSDGEEDGELLLRFFR
ncbi:hypothetical protein BDR05DRAFT_991063 [Suillus weaverae]|nr:hypothetical protein BDR05DRAFT_991063 [Suillus weaverae]